jgi:hypothetical protein
MTPPACILIMDDERIVALDLARRLSQLGYTIAGLATSGSDVITQALTYHPDLVLMDLRLPGAVDGLEAAQFLRTHLNLPVLVVRGPPMRLPSCAPTKSAPRACWPNLWGTMTCSRRSTKSSPKGRPRGGHTERCGPGRTSFADDRSPDRIGDASTAGTNGFVAFRPSSRQRPLRGHPTPAIF